MVQIAIRCDDDMAGSGGGDEGIDREASFERWRELCEAAIYDRFPRIEAIVWDVSPNTSGVWTTVRANPRDEEVEDWVLDLMEEMYLAGEWAVYRKTQN